MMHIGLSLIPFGHHPAAWRDEGADLQALDVNALARQIQRAREGTLDFVYLDDARAQRPVSTLSPQTVPFEPTTLVAAMATLAKDIGFIAAAATHQHELYNLARRYASLDLISRGRVGWDCITERCATTWDMEYVDVVKALWESWDADAFVYDKAAGQFFSPQKMHVLAHRGEHFTVRGPLNVNPSPQGRPVLATTLSADTLPFAARFAELAFVTSQSADEGRTLATEFRRQVVAANQARGAARIVAAIVPWVAATREQALECIGELRASPNCESVDSARGRDVIGTAREVADELQRSYEVDGLDGFLIMPPLPASLGVFIEQVVPELRRRGLFRVRYDGSTLRDHLELPLVERTT